MLTLESPSPQGHALPRSEIVDEFAAAILSRSLAELDAVVVNPSLAAAAGERSKPCPLTLES
jgi:ABC-type metal ion transport system substrate-binding protein